MTIQPISRRHGISWCFILLSVFILTACSFAPTTSDMLPDHFDFGKRRPFTVSLDVTGDEGDFNTLGALLPANELEAAIETSIVQSGLFSQVVQGKNADYQLTVQADSSNPTGFFNITVQTRGMWVLRKLPTQELVMDDFVSVSYTSSFGDSFLGVKRVPQAIAGAAKKFVEEGLRRLGRADF